MKQIFSELGLQQRYVEYERDAIHHIEAMISQLDEGEGMPKAVFESILSMVVKRRKWQV